MRRRGVYGVEFEWATGMQAAALGAAKIGTTAAVFLKGSPCAWTAADDASGGTVAGLETQKKGSQPRDPTERAGQVAQTGTHHTAIGRAAGIRAKRANGIGPRGEGPEPPIPWRNGTPWPMAFYILVEGYPMSPPSYWELGRGVVNRRKEAVSR